MKKEFLKYSAVTAGFICISFILGLVLQHTFSNSTFIPAIFILGSFLTSVFTGGYLYGIAAALISVFAVNFAFTFPYFAFDFTIPENIISAIILLIISTVTCGLATKIKHQEQIKEESQRERMHANLLRAVSHDLRTPLTTIYGSSTALLDNYDEFSDSQKKQMLGGISEDSQWLVRMVENLLSITKLDATDVKIIKSDAVLEELIDSVLIKFSKRYPNQKVHIDIPDELVIIPMDALLIEQVAVNILENAVQHAEGMTELTLRVFIISGKAVFEIKDNGSGIPKEKMKHIFTGCYSSDTSRGEGKNNAGIGLSVCASIIKAHDGDIRAENLKKGGCIFRFTLDMEASDE